MTKANRKLTGARQAERRGQVAGLYLRGTTKGQIAEALGIHRNTVGHDVAWLERQWIEAVLDNPNRQRAIELAKLEEAERIAATKATTTGSERWWDRWMKAMERRAKLLGLDAPLRVEATGEDHGPVLITLVDLVKDVQPIIDSKEYVVIEDGVKPLDVQSGDGANP